MATLFGMFPFLKRSSPMADIKDRNLAKALAKVLPHLNVEIVKRSDRVSEFRGPAQTLDRRALHRLAQSLPTARQGLGEPEQKGARVLAPRINPPHAQKTMQSGLKSPDRL